MLLLLLLPMVLRCDAHAANYCPKPRPSCNTTIQQQQQQQQQQQGCVLQMSTMKAYVSYKLLLSFVVLWCEQPTLTAVTETIAQTCCSLQNPQR
jgi:L-lactate permease